MSGNLMYFLFEELYTSEPNEGSQSQGTRISKMGKQNDILSRHKTQHFPRLSATDRVFFRFIKDERKKRSHWSKNHVVIDWALSLRGQKETIN